MISLVVALTLGQYFGSFMPLAFVNPLVVAFTEMETQFGQVCLCFSTSVGVSECWPINE